MNKIMKFLLLKAVAIHSGHNIAIKIKSAIILGLITSIPVTFLARVNDWYVDNENYVLWVLYAIMADHIIGTIYHAFWLRDFDLKKNISGLIVKLLMIVFVGFLFEGLSQLITKAEVAKEYLEMALRIAVFLYPAMSAIFNVYEITNNKFPPSWVMNYLKSFQETGKLKNPKETE